MRKNQKFGKNLKDKIFIVYEVNGLNFQRLLSALDKAGINVYNVHNRGGKKTVLSVKYSDSEKFFAISKELCYNVKKIKERGGFYPALFFWRNLGVLLGLALFFVAAYICNDFIFSFSFCGSGSVYCKEVENYLNGVGINRFSRFSDINLKDLGGNIVKSNPRLSFASCVKEGNRLKIELVLSENPPEIIDGNVDKLIALNSGIVESVKVYRGTALVKVGDAVNMGDVLVDGVMTVKEQTVKVNVIATVTVICEQEFIYVSAADGEEEKALLLAEENFSDFETKDYKVEKIFDGENYTYSVRVGVKYVFHAG